MRLQDLQGSTQQEEQPEQGCDSICQCTTSSRGRLLTTLASTPALAGQLRTLPRQASLNLVPLPQPRGQGKPILRFLQEAARETAAEHKLTGTNAPFAQRSHNRCNLRSAAAVLCPTHRSHFMLFKNFSRQCVW